MSRRRGFSGVLLWVELDEAVEGEQHLQLLHDVRGRVIHIESETRAGDDGCPFPSTITQATEHEAADILDGVLFGLGIFRYCSTVSDVV